MLGEALPENHELHHHHAVVLLDFSINLSFPLAGSRRRRHLPSRTCVERGGAVRSALVIGDLDRVEHDYIITVLLNASARDLQGYVDALFSLSLLEDSIDCSW